jgi:Holliday junction resolvase-like predicted endonuclease
VDESLHKMSKPYSQMTPSERHADRIAKNREIDRRVQEAKAEASAPVEVRYRRKAAADALEEFQRIKRERGIDAASEYVRNKNKAPQI